MLAVEVDRSNIIIGFFHYAGNAVKDADDVPAENDDRVGAAVDRYFKAVDLGQTDGTAADGAGPQGQLAVFRRWCC